MCELTAEGYLHFNPKESSGAIGFTRVAAPSVVGYAQAMVKIIQKLGWQSLTIVVSTTYDGKIFADAMNYLASKEKWIVSSTLWIEDESLNEIEAVVRNVIQSKPDVVIGHIRQRSNEKLFRAILDLQAVSSAWLLSDVSTYGVRNMSSIPSGVIMVSAKTPEMGHDYELYINALYDSFVLFESAFKRSLVDLDTNDRQRYLSSGKSKCLREKVMR